MPGYAGSRSNDRPLPQRAATTQWEVAVGVPPVIEPPEPTVSESVEPEIDEEMERFREWYREIAAPWTIEGNLPSRESRNAD
jgi:hypothetical protein